MKDNSKIDTNVDKFAPKNVHAIFALIIAVVGIICHIVMMITGQSFTDINIIMKIFVLFLLFIGLFIGGWILFYMFFSASIDAYEKDLPNKKEIYLINILLFWTVIVPLILHTYVTFKDKKNMFTDD